MTMIMRAQSDEWPSRLAWKVVKELMIKYKPNNNMARVEARMMLNKVSMKSDDDQSILFEQISQIQNRFGMAACTIEDGHLITAAIAAVPNEYRSIVAADQQICGGELCWKAPMLRQSLQYCLHFLTNCVYFILFVPNS